MKRINSVKKVVSIILFAVLVLSIPLVFTGCRETITEDRIIGVWKMVSFRTEKVTYEGKTKEFWQDKEGTVLLRIYDDGRCIQERYSDGKQPTRDKMNWYIDPDVNTLTVAYMYFNSEVFVLENGRLTSKDHKYSKMDSSPDAAFDFS